MKFVAGFVLIISLLAITQAQRARNSNRRRGGLNFADLIPSTQRNKSPYSTRRAESVEETPPELAQFSDLIPAEQIGDDIPPPSQKQISNAETEDDALVHAQEDAHDGDHDDHDGQDALNDHISSYNVYA